MNKNGFSNFYVMGIIVIVMALSGFGYYVLKPNSSAEISDNVMSVEKNEKLPILETEKAQEIKINKLPQDTATVVEKKAPTQLSENNNNSLPPCPSSTATNCQKQNGQNPLPATIETSVPKSAALTPAPQLPTNTFIPKPSCISNSSPTFTHHITDINKVSYIAPPPTMASGNNLKPHSYIGTNGVKVPVYAPTAMTLKDGGYYVQGPYILDFQVSCEVTVRFGHMTNPVDSIKNLFPGEPGSDSRTHEVSPVSFVAGELIGYTTGTNVAGNWDFGVFNSSVSNRYANDPAWNTFLLNTTAVCPFGYFTPDLKKAYTSKFDTKILAGNPPHGESFCQ